MHQRQARHTLKNIKRLFLVRLMETKNVLKISATQIYSKDEHSTYFSYKCAITCLLMLSGNRTVMVTWWWGTPWWFLCHQRGFLWKAAELSLFHSQLFSCWRENVALSHNQPFHQAWVEVTIHWREIFPDFFQHSSCWLVGGMYTMWVPRVLPERNALCFVEY